MSGSDQLLDVLRRFVTNMGGAYDVNDVLIDLCDRVVDVVGAAGAGVSVATGGELRFVTATSDRVVQMERAQESERDGPCVEAFRTGEPVAIDDLDGVDRWPGYRRVAQQLGVGSVVGIPLGLDGSRIGSLNVYDDNVRRWTPADLDAMQIVADVATAYFTHAGRLAEARQLAEQLQHALDARVIIEQAKGMVARDHGTSVDEAFEALRSHSRRHRVPVREVAGAVVELGLELQPPGP